MIAGKAATATALPLPTRELNTDCNYLPHKGGDASLQLGDSTSAWRRRARRAQLGQGTYLASRAEEPVAAKVSASASKATRTSARKAEAGGAGEKPDDADAEEMAVEEAAAAQRKRKSSRDADLEPSSKGLSALEIHRLSLTAARAGSDSSVPFQLGDVHASSPRLSEWLSSSVLRDR